MKKSVGIIGGNGQMGQAMQAILSAKGWDVHIADLDTKLSNKDLLDQSEIIFFAVPVHCMESVAKDIAVDVSDRHILIHCWRSWKHGNGWSRPLHLAIQAPAGQQKAGGPSSRTYHFP